MSLDQVKVASQRLSALCVEIQRIKKLETECRLKLELLFEKHRIASAVLAAAENAYHHHNSTLVEKRD